MGEIRTKVLAVEAVIGEPVSVLIPCSAGKYRENSPLEARDGDAAIASRAN